MKTVDTINALILILVVKVKSGNIEAKNVFTVRTASTRKLAL